MEIRLPNGKIIRGIPEGTSKEEVMSKAISAGYATAADFNASSTPAKQPPPMANEQINKELAQFDNTGFDMQTPTGSSTGANMDIQGKVKELMAKGFSPEQILGKYDQLGLNDNGLRGNISAAAQQVNQQTGQQMQPQQQGQRNPPVSPSPVSATSAPEDGAGAGSSFDSLMQGAGVRDAAGVVAADAVLKTVSSFAAPAIGGLSGLLSAAVKSDVTMENAGDVAQEVNDMLTYRPRTSAVKDTLATITELVAPVAEVMESAKTGLGDAAFKYTGSPAMAAMAYTAPDAVLSIMGVKNPLSRVASGKGFRAHKTVKNRPTQREVTDFISETPADAVAIRKAAKTGFAELETAKFKFSDRGIGEINAGMEKILNKYSREQGNAGYSTIENAMNQLRRNPTPNTLDEVYGQMVEMANKGQGDLGGIMAIQGKDVLLDFMDNPKAANFKINLGDVKRQGMSPAGVIKTYRQSKDLWRRSKRLDAVGDMIENARIKSLSGERTFDKALSGEIEKLRLNNKEMRLFTKEETKAMEGVLETEGIDKVANLLGALEFSNNKQTSIIMTSLAGGAGAAAAGAGGAATAGLGSLAVLYGIKKVGQRLKKNTTLAKAKQLQKFIASSGNDGKKLARIYMEATPKAKRSPQELAKLLADPKIDLDMEIGKHNDFMNEAVNTARGYRIMARAELTTALGIEVAQGLSNDSSRIKEEDK